MCLHRVFLAGRLPLDLTIISLNGYMNDDKKGHGRHDRQHAIDKAEKGV